jgi:hypothetical protein
LFQDWLREHAPQMDNDAQRRHSSRPSDRMAPTMLLDRVPLTPLVKTPAQPATQRRLLLTSSCWWPSPARIAMRFAALGWHVEAVCPSGHPLRETAAVDRVHGYGALRPLAALEAAIAAAQPGLIVPCDDRSAMHLHDLHARLDAAGAPAAQLIERSLGRIESCRIAQTRSELVRIAREAGVRAPEMLPVESAAALRAALAEVGLPAVLKVDGTWGGIGVMAVRSTEQAERVRSQLARRPDAARALKRLLVNRDPYHLRPWLDGVAPKVGVQRFVPGRPANSVAACWDGEVLAAIHVEVLCPIRSFGPSSVVRVIEHPEMAKATKTMARRLGLSGFCGLDFMIEDATGDAHLIEINARPTPLCHLGLGAGRDPVAALVARLEGAPPPAPAAVTDKPVITFFPQAWLAEPNSEALRTGYHDVPWEDPGLLRELVRPPYPARSLLARLWHRQQPLNA